MVWRGNLKIAVLRVKFADVAQEQRDDGFYYDLFINRFTGGLNDYYINASGGNVNFDDSILLPWKSTVENRQDFLTKYAGRNNIINAACAIHGIDRSQFFAVVAIFNASTGDASSAGNGVLLSADAPIELEMRFLAHEIGHCFGFMDSYDESDRRQGSDPAEGWYWDQYDIMSARNTFSYSHPRWGMTGPNLAMPYKEFAGWTSKVYTTRTNVDHTDEIRLLSYANPLSNGYTCIRYDNWYVEFRTPDFFDTGLARPCILIHSMTPEVNAVVHNRNPVNWVNEWQVGDVFGAPPLVFSLFGGVRIEILGYNLQTGDKYARIRISVRRRRPPPVFPPTQPPVFPPIIPPGPLNPQSAPVAAISGQAPVQDLETNDPKAPIFVSNEEFISASKHTVDEDKQEEVAGRIRRTLEGIALHAKDEVLAPPAPPRNEDAEDTQ